MTNIVFPQASQRPAARTSRGINHRLGKSIPFEEAVADKLVQLGFHVARNGTEHTFPEFTKLLRRSEDSTSLAIRFQPDGVACIGDIPRSFYWEAKASNHIEKTAWEQYMNCHEVGNVLIIIFEYSSEWRWNFIEDIQLIPASETVGRFPPCRRFPVVDGWITPRGSARWNEIKSRNPQASGTPYREVDMTSLLSWAEFKSKTVKRLALNDHQTRTILP